MIKLLLVPLFAISATLVHGADLSTTDFRGETICFLEGVVVKSDPERVKSMLQKAGCETLVVDSSGGDVDAALDIGRQIREREMTVSVSRKGRCASACVFLYAGAVSRAPYGPVEIHRPYLTQAKGSFGATRTAYDIAAIKIKAFLREMNVSESLFEKMMQIEPENLKALTIEEMKDLGLGFTDSIYSEFIENAKVAKAGMTKVEWIKMKQSATTTCGNIAGAVPKEQAQTRVACWKRTFPEYFSN